MARERERRAVRPQEAEGRVDGQERDVVGHPPARGAEQLLEDPRIIQQGGAGVEAEPVLFDPVRAAADQRVGLVERHLEAGAAQVNGRAEAAEPAADDEDAAGDHGRPVVGGRVHLAR